jgi:predicted O-linked N-acetylglucosamine transferase (SPINDLY family)
MPHPPHNRTATLSLALAIGLAHHRKGQLELAEEIYRRILAQEPDHAETLHLAGALAYETGRSAEAVERLRRAAAVDPSRAQYLNSLGLALADDGRFDEAEAAYRRALGLQPAYPPAHNNLGLVRRVQGRLAEAADCYRRALALRPDYAEAYANLGMVLADQGQPQQAVDAYRRALAIRPAWARVHSHLLHTLHFCPAVSRRELYDEHRRWNTLHAAPLASSIRPHHNDRSRERRLRVGYVSPDFRSHPVGRFLVPLLESHDRAHVEVFCYSSTRSADAITKRCVALSDVFRDVRPLTDEQVAEAVRADQIDILVDLTMHMEDNRLLAFARRPAPVQVTYLAYCGTTGLDAIDYRLSDPFLDPPGGDETIYSEHTICLPETYWCYAPLADCPPVGPLPAVAAGHVTFGCLNSVCKLNEATLDVWARVLNAVPTARLLLHAREATDRQRVQGEMVHRGIAPERLAFAAFAPLEEYFSIYGRIDVALDPFPYGGGTTTCDALWMGVPLVSLAGTTAVGRSGVSILSSVGLPELVVQDHEQYVRIAAHLAADLPRLADLRATLRGRMQRSPLMDAPRFARGVEAAYRNMWRRWCTQ